MAETCHNPDHDVARDPRGGVEVSDESIETGLVEMVWDGDEVDQLAQGIGKHTSLIDG